MPHLVGQSQSHVKRIPQGFHRGDQPQGLTSFQKLRKTDISQPESMQKILEPHLIED